MRRWRQMMLAIGFIGIVMVLASLWMHARFAISSPRSPNILTGQTIQHCISRRCPSTLYSTARYAYITQREHELFWRLMNIGFAGLFGGWAGIVVPAKLADRRAGRHRSIDEIMRDT